ncbi:MAG: hypothetical protein QOC55_1537 [Thermoleophilaceae bacterium]|nr:hypothetical protein [Thermoleophilaceae bacterium]
MTLTDRDRRIMFILLPIIVLIAYWFLLLSPKRSDLNTARDAQHQAEQARDQAVAQAAQLDKARQTFAADYSEVVRLGKAIPETVDAPSLLVQLDRASHGTHIDFKSITFGTRSAGGFAVPAASTTQAAPQPNGNAAVGGAPAATGLGRASESAGNAVNTGNQASTSVDNASSAAGDTSTTTSTTTTTPGAAPTGPATTAPSLDTVALTFNFSGSYFDLADFFHRLKRFVYVANDQVFVRGRLLTIDSVAFSRVASATGTGSNLTATVGATVYLSPQGQGVTGGATPGGPPGTTSTTTTTPAGSQTSSVPLATAGVR